MSLTITQQSNPTTLVLAGRLDTNTAPELDTVLNRVLANTRLMRLVFDLGRLEYMSSAGIRCLVRARKAIEAGGGQVAVVNPQPPVRKVLEIVKAIPEDGVFASVEELDEYLDVMQRKARGEV